MPKRGNPKPEQNDDRHKHLSPAMRAAMEAGERAWRKLPPHQRKSMDEINRIVREIRGGG